MYINIEERHGGLSQSTDYHFIIEENKLVHISRYAVSSEKRPRAVKYTLDLNKVKGSTVVKISVTNSGIICSAFVFPAEELALNWQERHEEVKPLLIINEFKLTYLKPHEITFLQDEWKRYYVPMINELKEFFKASDVYVGTTILIKCQVESGVNYPLSYLIPYSEVARRKSLEGLTKEIHQIWVVSRILKYLTKLGVLRSEDLLTFKQSPYYALASFHHGGRAYSIWYEFDMNPPSMCEGMLWCEEPSEAIKKFYERTREILRKRRLKRLPLRPDIAIIEGGSSCNELKKGFRVKAIIECKNQDYNYWAKDIDYQIIPYKEIFKPDVMVLASLKKIPNYVKKHLNRYGIIVVDGVFPGGNGEKELVEVITKSL